MSNAAAEERFSIDPNPPEWVELRPEIDDPGQTGDPVRIILSDDQVDTATRTSYRRAAQRLNNQQGVQAISQVQINFDPQTQELVIHSIAVIRDGQRREVATDRTLFRVLQRETSLDRQICDGTLSAVMLVEDVRVGDILDVSHSIIDRDLVFPNRYSMLLPLNHPVPIDHNYLTLRCTPDFKVDFGGEEKMENTQGDGVEIWRLHTESAEPIEPDIAAPPWILQTPHVQVGNYESWQEVSAMTAAQWEEISAQSETIPELDAQLAQINQAANGNPAAMADAAIAFVQDEIRYLGVEGGISSYVPEVPSRVYTRRFGDCKDKSLLLSHMLGRLGIPASAALVNDDLRRGIDQLMPSPHAFNHVIVMYEVGGHCYFADPTTGGQGGATGSRFTPAFGSCLPIQNGGSLLVGIPNPDQHSASLMIEEEFFIGKKNLPTRLVVKTTAKGGEADALRHAIASAGDSGAEREIENLYKEIYPGCSRVGNLGQQDDRSSNTLTLTEEFTIPEMLQRTPGGRFWGLAAHGITGRLIGSPEEERKLPLALPFPNQVRHHIQVHTPTPFTLNPEHDTIEGPGFNFSFSSRMQKKVLQLEYGYENTTDSVSTENYKNYMEKLERVAASSGFAIPAGGLPWWVVVIALAATFAFFGFLTKACQGSF